MMYDLTIDVYLKLYLYREIEDKHSDNFSRFDH